MDKNKAWQQLKGILKSYQVHLCKGRLKSLGRFLDGYKNPDYLAKITIRNDFFDKAPFPFVLSVVSHEFGHHIQRSRSIVDRAGDIIIVKPKKKRSTMKMALLKPEEARLAYEFEADVLGSFVYVSLAELLKIDEPYFPGYIQQKANVEKLYPLLYGLGKKLETNALEAICDLLLAEYFDDEVRTMEFIESIFSLEYMKR